MFREVDRAEERAAPRPEVLGGELLSEVDLHVVVQPLARQVVEIALPAVLEDTCAALYSQQPANLVGEVLVDELRTDSDAPFRGEREPNARPANADVAPEQGRHAVGSLTRISFGADAEPAERNETKCNGRNAFAIELFPVQVLAHRGAQFRQVLAEADQPVVLLLLLL